MRTWHIVDPEQRAGPAGRLRAAPRGKATLLADDASSIHARATFASNALWVTEYDPAQRYPAGDFVDQNAGGAGLPSWVQADRPVDGEDVVVWHTFGTTHFPRPEDWPIMPVDYTGFTLKPSGVLRPQPRPRRPADQQRALPRLMASRGTNGAATCPGCASRARVQIGSQGHDG